MGSTVEVIISVRLDAETEHVGGISGRAEAVVDELFYLHNRNASDALAGAEEALRDALRKCEQRKAVA